MTGYASGGCGAWKEEKDGGGGKRSGKRPERMVCNVAGRPAGCNISSKSGFTDDSALERPEATYRLLVQVRQVLERSARCREDECA